MSLIHIDGLTKHFKILNRREGLSGAFRDLFSGNYRTVEAVVLVFILKVKFAFGIGLILSNAASSTGLGTCHLFPGAPVLQPGNQSTAHRRRLTMRTLKV